MAEIWRLVPEYPDYEASSLGRIRRATDGRNYRGVVVFPKGRLLKSRTAHKTGYLILQVCSAGKIERKGVHQLVCSAFRGPRPSPKHHAAHLDGDKINNRPENLRWATAQENEADKLRHGTRLRGDRNHQSTLTEADVRRIKGRLAEGQTQVSLAAEYGITQAAISAIKLGKNWGWLNDELRGGKAA